MSYEAPEDMGEWSNTDWGYYYIGVVKRLNERMEKAITRRDTYNPSNPSWDFHNIEVTNVTKQIEDHQNARPEVFL